MNNSSFGIGRITGNRKQKTVLAAVLLLVLLLVVVVELVEELVLELVIELVVIRTKGPVNHSTQAYHT